MYNLLIGGAAGQGIDTTAAILEKLLMRSGYAVFTSRDFMSRVRGGHNFTQIRFGDRSIYGHSDELDGIIALNEETARLHAGRLKPGGFILCDSAIQADDPRTIRIDMNAIAKAAGNPKASHRRRRRLCDQGLHRPQGATGGAHEAGHRVPRLCAGGHPAALRQLQQGQYLRLVSIPRV